MLKSKNLTNKNKGIPFSSLIYILLKISLTVTLILVSFSTFYLLFKSGYIGLATLLYKLLILDLVLIGLIPLIKIISDSIKNAK